MTSASLDTKAKSTGVKKTNKRILVPDRGAVGERSGTITGASMIIFSGGSMFKTNPVSLKELLDDVESGKIQLPDFQRGWVWDDDRIRGLLASISRGFPVGAIRGGPSAHLRAVLVEGHIPYPVEAVLDAPVPTGKAQQSPGIGIFLALHDPLAL